MNKKSIECVLKSNTIVVDLDGTLIKGDSSWKLFKKIWKNKRWEAIKILFIYLFKGEGRAKMASARYIDLAEYELHDEVMDFILKNYERKNIVLATGAHIEFAKKFVQKHPYFHEIIASENGKNMIGCNKLAAIKEKVKGDFAYIADSWQDFPIWEECEEIGVVKPSSSLRNAIKRLKKTTFVFE